MLQSFFYNLQLAPLNIGNLVSSPFGNTQPPTECFESTLLTILRNGLVIFIVVLFLGLIVTMANVGLRYMGSDGSREEAEKAFAGLRNIVPALILFFIILMLIYAVASAAFPEFNYAQFTC